jgi:hypothetical protein
MCCRRGPSSPSSSPARAQKSTRGTQDAGAPDDERQPSGGTYGRVRCVAQLNDESERARERERVRLDRQCAREREPSGKGVCMFVCRQRGVCQFVLARVFVGRVVRVRVGGGGAHATHRVHGCTWCVVVESVESWRRSGPRHACRGTPIARHMPHHVVHTT